MKIDEIDDSLLFSFESLDMSAPLAQKRKSELEGWLETVEKRIKSGDLIFIGRSCMYLTENQKLSLNAYFEKTKKPNSRELRELAEKLNLDQKSVKTWFDNKH